MSLQIDLSVDSVPTMKIVQYLRDKDGNLDVDREKECVKCEEKTFKIVEDDD